MSENGQAMGGGDCVRGVEAMTAIVFLWSKNDDPAQHEFVATGKTELGVDGRTVWRQYERKCEPDEVASILSALIGGDYPIVDVRYIPAEAGYKQIVLKNIGGVGVRVVPEDEG